MSWSRSAVIEETCRMLDRRQQILDRGEGIIGWKLAFGASETRAKLGLDGPVVGLLLESGNREPGSTVSCEGWVNPVAEPEVAVHFDSDVPDPDRVMGSISAIGAAIELADVDAPAENIGEVFARNLFHRAVVLGPPDPSLRNIVGMRAQVSRNGSVITDTEELEAVTGGLESNLGHVAALLLEAGEMLRTGDVLIAGSIVPPISVRPGDEFAFELVPLSPISVTV
jgi:2-keto-4-pentenoate hydratase